MHREENVPRGLCDRNIRTVRGPTLIVLAGRSAPRGVAERMLRTAPQAQLVDIPDVGHDVHLEQPERCSGCEADPNVSQMSVREEWKPRGWSYVARL
jgi:pimeloyl-ACP methyl ester carboxylesterase